MVNDEKIFSVRLVVVDFYMEKPIFGLDPCYSEFRGREIKKVPIIRIFGSNTIGQKTCMHIHGVFPYFYIPYEQKDFETLNQAFYQIAINLDKAINISLGQASSAAQHVFKIQLVKGIPFYGYHRREHQFLKIYMFNPRFVRRAANLLQNGAILGGKIFHPHESHVPYILQFMIDFNLYGMSLLHVPLEIVKFRPPDGVEDINYPGIQPEQILSEMVAKKISNSALEVDIGANFILNRFLLITQNNSTHKNPGIESIWNDEQIRRQKLIASLEDEEELEKIPPLEIPATQERPELQPVESEQFYRSALLSKLLVMETSISGSGEAVNQTLNSSFPINSTQATLNFTNLSNREKKRTFNLKKLLVNAVYPEECTQDDLLTNASFVENHLSNTSSVQTTLSKNIVKNSSAKYDQMFLDDTAVDEELVLNLTQNNIPLNATLREQDFELLDVLEQLEDLEANKDHIDFDSSLAQLSQNVKKLDRSPESCDKVAAAIVAEQPTSDNEVDSDNEDENLSDFTMLMEDVDAFITKLTQSQTTNADETVPLPQIDGSDDLLKTPKKASILKRLPITGTKQQPTSPRTPNKAQKITRRLSLAGSPSRSPRTPRSSVASKYAPLPLIIKNQSEKKNVIESNEQLTPKKLNGVGASIEAAACAIATSPTYSKFKHKNNALREVRRNIIAKDNDKLHEIEDMANFEANPRIATRRSGRMKMLDKTHITCALTPRRSSEKKLKVYTPENCKPNISNKSAKNTRTKNIFEKEGSTKNVNIRARHESNEDKIEVFNDDKKKLLINKKPQNKAKIAKQKHLPEETPKKTQSNPKSPTISFDDSEKLSIGEKLLDASPTHNKCDTAEKLCSKTKLHESVVMPLMDKELVLMSPMDKKSVVTSPIGKEDFSDKEEIMESENELNDSIKVKRRSGRLKRYRKSLTIKSKQSPVLSKNTQAILDKSSKIQSILSDQNCLTPTMAAGKLSQICDSPLDGPFDDDLLAQSFYDKSFLFNSPSVFSDYSQHSPVMTTKHNHFSSPRLAPPNSSSAPTSTVIITPLDLPPTYDEVLTGCLKFDIPELDFQQPFYSNPADVTQKKEIGLTVLSIPCNKLNDCPEYVSVLGPQLKGLNDWRKKQIQSIGGPAMLNRFRSTQQIREYLATQKSVCITPLMNAPSKHDAKVWLKARELMTNKKEVEEGMKSGVVCLTEDSPIKIERKKITMMLNGDGGTSSGDEDRDFSSRSLTLTPMTPPITIPGGKEEKKSNISGLTSDQTDISTPLTTHSKPNSISAKQRRLRSKRVRLSLRSKFKKADDNQDDTLTITKIKTESPALNPSQEKLRDSQSSNPSSIASQEVMNDLGRPSFLNNLNLTSSGQHDVSFGLSHATLNNTFGFKVNLENLQQAKANIEYNYLTTITLEVFVPTRADYYPDPFRDEIRCIFYAIENSIPTQDTVDDHKKKLPRNECGYIIVNDHKDIMETEGKRHGIDADIKVQVVHSEIEALHALLDLCSLWDPDIYAGYEIEMSSWGYILDRAKQLNFNISSLLSRIPTQKVRDVVDEDRDQFTDLDIEMKLCGRILLDVWRLMRSEIALTSYTFENVMYHIMHNRCPCHSYADLTAWFASPGSRWITIEYYLERVRGTLALLDQLDLIGRTCEMAKLIGIQFYEVLSRGSQFRVESMMLRIAKPRNLVPLSPSVQQRAHMRAPEYLALIMEPLSRLYVDPVIVLDFQSLYPSMIIAYNYCFSTCLGRVEHLGQTSPFEFGASQLKVSPAMLRHLLDEDLITISPCGVVFVKSSVRDGILPRMLTEILDTRQMVKQSMKLHKNNTALQRILHSRQLGLKLMANVTYGYTAANFSGRMPSVEVGDTVVSKGRETLERAIKMVETNEKWNVKVVYGDTDSLFVQVPGRSRAKAFEIGAEIAEAITKANPHPVKLKLEKVYQPCILQTKKRYVGYMYETPDQTEPIYEAKGIETVRRDGCPAAVKMLEKVLRILFETKDVSQVKQYVCRQFTKLLSGRANLQDLIFAKEFRGLNGYKPTACVPALELTRKWIQTDPRRIPRRGERVPFIITNGPPGVPLIRLVRSPHELLADEGLKINAIYYITKAIIPPLNRCLLLIGADVNDWFANLPRKLLATPALSNANEVISNSLNAVQVKKSTISQYFSATNCIIDCGRHTKNGICGVCDKNPMKSIAVLQNKIGKTERGFYTTQQICQACCGRIGDINCMSLDCPVLFVLTVKRKDMQQTVHFRNLLQERF